MQFRSIVPKNNIIDQGYSMKLLVTLSIGGTFFIKPS